jgi:hypothetical protein
LHQAIRQTHLTDIPLHHGRSPRISSDSGIMPP